MLRLLLGLGAAIFTLRFLRRRRAGGSDDRPGEVARGDDFAPPPVG